MTDEEALLDYRRSVAGLYAGVRQPSSDGAESCQRFRQERDALFRSHAQSALSSEQKAALHGLPYYDYNPAFRFLLPVDPNVAPEVLEVELDHDGLLRMRRFGTVHVSLAGQTLTLSLFWLLGYGGVCSCRSVTQPTATRPMVVGVTCWTPSNTPIWGR